MNRDIDIEEDFTEQRWQGRLRDYLYDQAFEKRSRRVNHFNEYQGRGSNKRQRPSRETVRGYDLWRD